MSGMQALGLLLALLAAAIILGAAIVLFRNFVRWLWSGGAGARLAAIIVVMFFILLGLVVLDRNGVVDIDLSKLGDIVTSIFEGLVSSSSEDADSEVLIDGTVVRQYQDQLRAGTLNPGCWPPLDLSGPTALPGGTVVLFSAMGGHCPFISKVPFIVFGLTEVRIFAVEEIPVAGDLPLRRLYTCKMLDFASCIPLAKASAGAITLATQRGLTSTLQTNNGVGGMVGFDTENLDADSLGDLCKPQGTNWSCDIKVPR